MGQLIQSREHVQETQKSVEEIGPPPAQTSGDQDNGQTPPTATMETATTNTHVSVEQVATPTSQTTLSTPAGQDMSATDSDTAHARQPMTKEIMSADADQQHKQSWALPQTTQDAQDKETQTRINQTDAAVQTDSLPQDQR